MLKELLAARASENRLHLQEVRSMPAHDVRTQRGDGDREHPAVEAHIRRPLVRHRARSLPGLAKIPHFPAFSNEITARAFQPVEQHWRSGSKQDDGTERDPPALDR